MDTATARACAQGNDASAHKKTGRHGDVRCRGMDGAGSGSCSRSSADGSMGGVFTSDQGLSARPFLVRDLRRALRDAPDDAVVMVRVDHDCGFNPGDDGYEPAWGDVFYCSDDNSLNIE